VKLLDLLLVAGAAALTAGCGGGGVEGTVGEYANNDVTNCRDTGEVDTGLAVYNCGFADGSQGCYIVNSKAKYESQRVKQLYGGRSCPDIGESAGIKRRPEDGFQPANEQEAIELAASMGGAHCDNPGMRASTTSHADIARRETRAFFERNPEADSLEAQRAFRIACLESLRSYLP
jgi:hypothetical protein